MHSILHTFKLTRAGVFILLAMLLVLLGAAAKHSQFDGPPHHGYLAKAVKMVDGARSQVDGVVDVMPCVVIPVSEVTEIDRGTTRPIAVDYRFTPVSLSSPPLRA